jgi:hypothetical protein
MSGSSGEMSADLQTTQFPHPALVARARTQPYRLETDCKHISWHFELLNRVRRRCRTFLDLNRCYRQGRYNGDDRRFRWKKMTLSIHRLTAWKITS